MMISLAGRILDFIVPRTCVVCHRRLGGEEDILCGVCRLHLPRTGFEDDFKRNALARLFWARFPIENAWSLFRYDRGNPPVLLVECLKYGRRTDIGERLGQWAGDEIGRKGFFQDIDAILPVPLTRQRLRRRGYNQSELLARALARCARLPVIGDAVERTAFQTTQTRLDRWARRDNVQGVFRVVRPDAVKDRHILIVDDVITTGATVTSCACALVDAGAARISVLSLACAAH